ncbi:MAG: DUF2797 domain-containing protein [Bacteroidota bacterium]
MSVIGSGNLRKMRSELHDEVQYFMPFYDGLIWKENVHMNPLIGKEISLDFEQQINCVVSGKSIKKAYGEGMSYEEFMKSPLASPSIIRPELSRIHEGIALRDEAWEREHHLQPHFTYLSLTSTVKVGVTRSTQIPTRWIDQGAVQGIILAETPYRQLAGLIEVELKAYVSDKTNWRNMLKNEYDKSLSLLEKKDEMLDLLPEAFHEFISDDDSVLEIRYPVLEYPNKVSSIKLDKQQRITGQLRGIKGQYLIFDSGVINIRSHAGYKVNLSLSE